MNLFTKSIFAGILPCAAVSAQGLYSIAPNDDEATSSLPLTYIVGANVGYDDNPTPLFDGEDENDGSAFVNVFVQANFASVSPQTTWDVFARVGGRYYTQNLDGDNIDDLSPDARVGVNFTHRFSERLRFSSRNFVAYENEPDFDFGFAGDRRAGDYLRYSTSNTLGYRWTERFGTLTGIDFTGVNYADLDDSDYTVLSLRQQFRYRISPATVVTAGYRYGVTNNDGRSDADAHYITGGVEHRISPTSAIVLRGGVQINNPDDGSSRTRPFFEGALRSQLTEQLGVNAFVRYSNENYNRGLVDNNIVHRFEQSDTLRVGAKATYALNPRVSIFGGVNYIFTDYDDVTEETAALGAETGNESLLNLNAGFSYQLSDNLYFTGSYNYTTSISDDFDDREYDRNRVQLGVQATF